MPKPVQIRANYRDDAAFLIRLEEAVAKDDRQTADWLKETCDQIRRLSIRLLEAKIDGGSAEAASAKKSGTKK